jgi:hypothetical protein
MSYLFHAAKACDAVEIRHLVVDCKIDVNSQDQLGKICIFLLFILKLFL